MYKFVKKIILFFIPLILLFAIVPVSYLILDPFRVIYTYDFNGQTKNIAAMNRDFIVTELFLQNNPEHHYNSFIFGSSRTMAYQGIWGKYLPDSASVFSFDASSESIYGIYSKIKYLDKNNTLINNALIILCRDVSFIRDNNRLEHLFIKHPLISGESKWDFQLVFFKAYCNPMFLMAYVDYSVSNKYKPYMGSYIVGKFIQTDREKRITENAEEYYSNMKFPERPETERIGQISQINSKQKFMLSEINRILKKHRTNYKVILSPLYEQIKWNPEDMNILKDCFGENLYDFSGKNKFSEDKINFYESSHYRPLVGDSIMAEIYK